MTGVPLRRVLAAAALTLAGFAPGVASGQAVTSRELFDALGGKPGIDLLVGDFVPRLASDERIGTFFKETNLAELGRQLADQFCAVAGGPCRYEGEDMKKAHADLDIGKADFNRLVEILQTSMEARGIPFAAQNRLLARLAPMHRDVIGKR